MPLELVGKVLPATAYARAAPRGEQITTWENELYNNWLPTSGYELIPLGDCRFQIQAYEEGRFKGVGDLLAESETDVYVPIAEVP
jgi:hypothetical protein